jgi:hypothetical protein
MYYGMKVFVGKEGLDHLSIQQVQVMMIDGSDIIAW